MAARQAAIVTRPARGDGLQLLVEVVLSHAHLDHSGYLPPNETCEAQPDKQVPEWCRLGLGY